MSRTIPLIGIVIVILVGFLVFHYAKETNQNSSLNTKEPLVSSSVSSEIDLHKWRQFSPSSGKFKVMLPGIPQHVTEMIKDSKSLESRKYDTYATGEENGPMFMLSTIVLKEPINLPETEEVLKKMLQEILARNENNNLKTMKFSNFHNLRALDFSMANGELLIAGKIFAHNNTIYILSMVNKSDIFNPRELSFFIDSFEFLDDTHSSKAPNGS